MGESNMEEVVVVKGLATKTSIGEGTPFICDEKQQRAFALSSSFHEGQVLVSTMTNPGMMEMIKKASAVACEKGGHTSHAVIVCRDRGIPCVVGAVGLLDKLNSFPHRPVMLVVNGTEGTVTIKKMDKATVATTLSGTAVLKEASF